MTDKHRQTEEGGGGPSGVPALRESPTPRASDCFAPAIPRVNRLGQLSWGRRCRVRCRMGKQQHLSRRLPSNSGEGDLAHYRGGRRIKVSRGWELGVDTEDAVPLETACLVLGYRGPLLGLGDSLH